MRLNFLLPILTAGFAALSALPAPAQDADAFRQVLKVNDSAVTGYEMDQRVKFLTLLGFPGDLRAEAERGLIEDRLRLQAAKRLSVTVSEDEIQAGMTEFAGRANLDSARFLAVLAQGGVDPEAFRDFVRAGVAWRGAVRARYADRVSATDAEIDRAMSSDYGRGDGPRVLLSEIIIPAQQGEMGRIGTLAGRLKDTIHGEADFARAARENSVAASRDDGGRVNWIPLSNLPPQVQGAISKLGQGQISAPVPMPGYVGLFLVRGFSQGGKVVPAEVAVDYAELRLPAGSEAEIDRISAAVSSCDDLYTATRGLPPGQLTRQTVRRARIGGAVGPALDRLDAGEKTTIRATDGSLSLLMLCSRTDTRAAGPIPPDLPVTIPAQPARTADGTIIPSVVQGVGFGLGPSRDQVREEVVNRKLAQLAEVWLAELDADAIITRP